MRDLTEGNSDFDYRRFRANLLVDTGDHAAGWVEDEWVGRRARNRRRRKGHLDRSGAAMRDDDTRAAGPAARPRRFCAPRCSAIRQTSAPSPRSRATAASASAIRCFWSNEFLFLMAVRRKAAAKAASGNILRGRFAKGRLPEVEAFTASLPFDRRLFRHDIRGSIAHANMLAKVKLMSRGRSDGDHQRPAHDRT